MATFYNTMANILVCTLLILFANELALAYPCTKVDSLPSHNITCCRIVPSVNRSKTNKDIRNHMESDQTALLRIEFDFPENTQKAIQLKQLESEKMNKNGASYFYDIFNWQILISHISDELLTLAPNFQTLSLNTLNVGVKVLNTKMIGKPHGCLANVTYHQYIFVVKEYLVHFIEETGNKNIMVCTSVMNNVGGEAKFHPICYGVQKKNGSRSCQYLDNSRWSHALNVFIYAIKCIAVLFCPIILPASIYTSKYINNAYRVNLEKKIPLKVMVSDRKPPKTDNNWIFCLPMSYFKRWKSFKPGDLEVGVVHNFEVTALNLKIRSNTLVSKAHVPASLFYLIYEKLYLCKIGNDISFGWCCYSPVCPQHLQFKCSPTHTSMSWIKCCKGFMIVVLVLLIPLPWILRLIVYHYYEENDFDAQRKAAEYQGLSMSFKRHLLSFISPFHWSFLSIYVLYIIDLMFFGTLVKSVLRKLVKIIKESFQDMHSSMSFEIIRWGVSRYLEPFSYFGLVGFLLAPFYWLFVTPFVLILFCFYYIPLVSLFSRLILHLFWFCLPNYAINSKCFISLKGYAEKTHLISRHLKIEKISPHRKIINSDRRAEDCVLRHFQIVILLLSLLTVLAIILLMTECIGYIIDMVAFTLMGMILNTDVVLPYYSFVLMFVIYLSSSINDVRLIYLNFNKVIVSEVTDAAESDLKTRNHLSEAAYFIKPDECAPPLCTLALDKSGAISFQASSLLLFISQDDQVYIPSDFFYKLCEIPLSSCPGSRSGNYCKAFIGFFYVLLFLIFVLVVVLSFGGLYDISSTLQMFAALAGGFIPWIFRNIVQLNPEPEKGDTDTMLFKKHFWTEIKNFQDNFKVEDFEVQLLSKEDSTNNAASSLGLVPDHAVIEIQTKTLGGFKHNSNRYVYFDGPFQMDV